MIDYTTFVLAGERAHNRHPHCEDLQFVCQDDPGGQGLHITFSYAPPAVICQQPDDPDSLDAAFDVLLDLVMVEARKRLERKKT